MWVSGVGEAADTEQDVGWGQVCVFLQRLGKKADSRSLSLAHCDLTATDLLELATLLQFLPQLEEMDLSWNELIGGCLKALTSYLHYVSGVRTLRLCSCRLNAEDIVAMGELFLCALRLELLDLSWNGSVGGGGLQGLLGKLHPVLRELHLVGCQLTAADITVLGTNESEEGDDLQKRLDSIWALTKTECHTGLFGIFTLENIWKNLLGLQGNLLFMPLRAGGSLRCLPSVRELDLSCNKSLSGGLNRLTVHLSHLTQLESLNLHLCCLTRADLEALIQVLPALMALTELDVSSNKEAGGVVHPLVSALPLTQMKRLPLSSCSLNEESCTALVCVSVCVSALAVPYLHSMDVSWCKVVGGRLALLLDALQPSVITELCLSSCDLTTDDLRHLAAVCRRGCLSSLRVLDVSYNGFVGDDGWSALFAAGGLGSLEDIDLSLRPSTSASCAVWFHKHLHLYITYLLTYICEYKQNNTPPPKKKKKKKKNHLIFIHTDHFEYLNN
uniref:Leucine rich repeat containing 31 n=1 Tax=Mastacembelus armatus TaxID=205130 RepID=A0A7N8X903_9TELE